MWYIYWQLTHQNYVVSEPLDFQLAIEVVPKKLLEAYFLELGYGVW